MTDAELIAKLKVPPGCELIGDEDGVLCFYPNIIGVALQTTDPTTRKIAACVALQYWRMELERLDEIHGRTKDGRVTNSQSEAVSQISYWTYFGGFE